MLVISRNKLEKIIFTVPPSAEPTQIAVTYLGPYRLQKQHGRIGIEAPSEVKVLRAELIPDSPLGSGENPSPVRG